MLLFLLLEEDVVQRRAHHKAGKDFCCFSAVKGRKYDGKYRHFLLNTHTHTHSQTTPSSSIVSLCLPFPFASLQKPHTVTRRTQIQRKQSREMSSEAEAEHWLTTPKLPLSFSVPPMPSPEQSGTVTPPLQTLASVPFRWEEEPGKPRPCTALVPFSDFTPKSLDLPPRLLFETNLTKLLSPTSVLEAPFASTDSLRSPPSFRIGGSAERGRLGALVLNRGGFREREGWWFWRKKGFRVKREASWGCYVFPSSSDRESDGVGMLGGSHRKKVEMTKMKRSGSFSTLTQAKSRLWVSFLRSLTLFLQ